MILGEGGWVGVANVRSGIDGLAKENSWLTIVGSGNGDVNMQMNFLANTMVTLNSTTDTTQRQNVTVEVDFLQGGNAITLFRMAGEPLIDAIMVR